MSFLLASLYSQSQKTAAIALLETTKGRWLYLQKLQTGNPVNLNMIRGISTAGNQLFTVSPASLLIYDFNEENDFNNQPWIKLHREVILPEWVLGPDYQAQLISVHASERLQKIYVSNNAYCAVDIFSFSGDFIERRFLWEVTPDYFPLPNRWNKRFTYGIIRSINEHKNGKITLTVASCNGSDLGAIIDLDTGSIISDNLEFVHGGIWDEDRFYTINVRKGILTVHLADENSALISGEPLMKIKPEIPYYWSKKNEEQNLRGLVANGGIVFCGAFNLNKKIGRRNPARIIGICKKTGLIKQQFMVPDMEEFQNPTIFDISSFPSILKDSFSKIKESLFFDGENKIIPTERHGSRIKVWGGPFPESIKEKIKGIKDTERREKPISKIEKDDGSQRKTIANDDNLITKNIESLEKKIGHDKANLSIEFDNVSLSYRRTARFGFGANKGLRKERVYWALRNISFRLFVGETIGIIGRNGSGKSTLTQLCSGVLFPDSGSVKRNGKVQLLSLGIGFRKEMTGRDNIYISGALLGLSRKQVEYQIDEIIDFAELEEFIDEPMATYSSGMRSRLGFAISTAIKPDILILDEIMATGDKAFRDKAIKRMQLMQKSAKTVIIVSHNPQQLKKLCSRILWIERGTIVMDSDFSTVLNAYNNFCQNPILWFEQNRLHSLA